MANKNVVLSFVITNDDGSAFASFEAKYANVPQEGVVAMERVLVEGVVGPLLEMGEQAAAKV